VLYYICPVENRRTDTRVNSATDVFTVLVFLLDLMDQSTKASSMTEISPDTVRIYSFE